MAKDAIRLTVLIWDTDATLPQPALRWNAHIDQRPEALDLLKAEFGHLLALVLCNIMLLVTAY